MAVYCPSTGLLDQLRPTVAIAMAACNQGPCNACGMSLKHLCYCSMQCRLLFTPVQMLMSRFLLTPLQLSCIALQCSAYGMLFATCHVSQSCIVVTSQLDPACNTEQQQTHAEPTLCISASSSLDTCAVLQWSNACLVISTKSP